MLGLSMQDDGSGQVTERIPTMILDHGRATCGMEGKHILRPNSLQ